MKARCALTIAFLFLLAPGVVGEQAATEKAWEVFELDDLIAEWKSSGRPWLRFLDVPTLYAGIYVLAAGGEDEQTPHDDDEVYYVIRGRGTVRVANEDRPVSPGSIIYVKAHVEHRFHDITEELQLLVFFSK
jgi:mannose-6-phosphate isomerase-like protein (cupin superfamily)